MYSELTSQLNSANNLVAKPCSERSRLRFERDWQRHQALFTKMARQYAASVDDAEDLLSQTALSAWRHYATFDPMKGSFPTWVGAILRREAADEARRAARRPQCIANDDTTTDLVENVAAPAPPDDEFGTEFLHLLPHPLRPAFALVRLGGLSSAEAAARLGTNSAVIRTQLWKARKTLLKAV